MKRFILLALIIFFSYHLNAEAAQLARIDKKKEIVLTDRSHLKILHLEGTDLSTWKPGHTVTLWRPNEYPHSVYRLVNLDEVSSVRVQFLGRK